MNFLKNKIHGLGLGLRFSHFNDILKSEHQCPWFEVITEDFLEHGDHHQKLLKLRQDYPISLHSVGLNLGGVDDIDLDYLKKIKSIYLKYQPDLVSDHLCWSSHQGKYHYDLLPIPRTKEGLSIVSERIDFIQNYLERPLVVENITSYIEYKEEDYSEIEFIQEISKKTGCFFLLDITNVLINFSNRGKNPDEFFGSFPMEKVKQIHLAGGVNKGNTIIDTHSEEVQDNDILELKKIKEKGYNIPAIIERDSNLPLFSLLEKERQEIEQKISI